MSSISDKSLMVTIMSSKKKGKQGYQAYISESLIKTLEPEELDEVKKSLTKVLKVIKDKTFLAK